MRIDFEIDYDLLADKIADRICPQRVEEKGTVIHGIRGLANYLHCSPSKAQDLKNKGIIPYSEVGRKVFFNSREVDIALKKEVICQK